MFLRRPLPPSLRPLLRTLLIGFTLGCAAASASAQCRETPAADPATLLRLDVAPEQAAAARSALRDLVGEALRRSQAIGAARLLAEAADDDLAETRASLRPQAALSGSAAQIGSSGDQLLGTHGGQARAGLNLSAPLYDAGRGDALVEWRGHLLEAARLAQLGAHEQVGLQTVALALERDRHGRQVEVWRQHVGRLACLVDSLEQIVAADKGRGSELVQARKTLRQAELAQAQTTAQQRQVEIRLRRFVGEAKPLPDGVAAALADLPPATELQLEASRAAEIVQLEQQAEAQSSYARAVVAGQKPQLGWAVSAARAWGASSSTSWSAGVNLNVPLLNPGADPAASAAQRRALAAREQRDDALAARLNRITETHEQALAAFDRVRRTQAVLGDSERVREATRQQWQQLGRRSLFDVMAAESEHHALQAAGVDALHDGRQAIALLWSLGPGLVARFDSARP